MYSRKWSDCSYHCGSAEDSKKGEKSEFHIDEKLVDREVFGEVF